MRTELLINGMDAYAVFGVRMGDGFLDVLGAPAPMKAYIENESRASDGKQILMSSARVASRQLNLEFTITGATQEEFLSNKNAFFELLYSGYIEICVPDNSADIYRLCYLGTSPTYAQSLSRCSCKVSVKFEEPNPRAR